MFGCVREELMAASHTTIFSRFSAPLMLAGSCMPSNKLYVVRPHKRSSKAQGDIKKQTSGKHFINDFAGVSPQM